MLSDEDSGQWVSLADHNAASEILWREIEHWQRIASEAARAAERALVESLLKLADGWDDAANEVPDRKSPVSNAMQRACAEELRAALRPEAATCTCPDDEFLTPSDCAQHNKPHAWQQPWFSNGEETGVPDNLQPEAATTEGARPPLDWSDSETWPPELSALLEREHGVGYRAGIEAEKQQRRDEAADAADLATVCAHCGAAIYDGSACKPDLCYLAARPSSTPAGDDAAAVHPDTEGER